MTWLQRYELRAFLRSAFWPAPVLTMALALIVLPVVRSFDTHQNWEPLGFTPRGASAILSAFNASMLTFMVFVMSSLLLVVQLASAQLTPRIIAPAFQRKAVRVALNIFIFSYIFSIGVLGRISDDVPQLGVFIAIVTNLASIGSFLYFIGALGMSLRPIVVIAGLAASGRRAILDVYPFAYGSKVELPSVKVEKAPFSVVTYSGRPGVVLAIDIAGLVQSATRDDCLFELLPRVGDNISDGDPLFNIYGSRVPETGVFASSVAVGPERTLQQDPMFAFRVLVDIASRALSPAINDPTTAVLVLDQLQHLLVRVGKRRLDAGVHSDVDGQIRLVCSTPDWEDFVTLATSEIRHYGASSFQVARRLRAMLQHLLHVLPACRAAAVQEELRLLQLAVSSDFLDLHERARAEVGDFQGIGGRELSRSIGPPLPEGNGSV